MMQRHGGPDFSQGIDLRLTPGVCRHCSTQFTAVMHGGPCPRVAEIEYHPDGTVKRIVYR